MHACHRALRSRQPSAGRLASVDPSLFAGEPVVLCHGDIHRGNVIGDVTGQLWLVDWEAVRFRVAAADFNQLHQDWLTQAQERIVVDEYVRLTGHEPERLRRQIAFLRVLWHLRTLNFHIRVHGQTIDSQRRHVEGIRALLKPTYTHRVGSMEGSLA